MKKPAKLSVNALSDKTGLDRRTIKRRLLESGLNPHEPHALSSVIEVLKPKASGDSPKDQTEFERWRKLKLANDRAEGLSISRAAVIAWFGALATRQKEILRRRLENEMPMAMSGVDPGSGRVIAKRVVDEVCAEMEDAVGKLG